jgi:hypothetical protein
MLVKPDVSRDKTHSCGAYPSRHSNFCCNLNAHDIESNNCRSLDIAFLRLACSHPDLHPQLSKLPCTVQNSIPKFGKPGMSQNRKTYSEFCT